ncbi:hypothetical protein CKO_01912 [Citrobacter koseri ATCC BAA-895]|uniref:Uncharacterized protein n=1 Tax=Citrobacter koseri (strain ATCC BAA-895 / CDC 4225-83 / SGSC4696) TaxID=290338 RepID=A8AHS4_CITK8|nr:hypothetical protein CKO_01912 [Citrobacter koseri ATCC BAA-895]
MRIASPSVKSPPDSKCVNTFGFFPYLDIAMPNGEPCKALSLPDLLLVNHRYPPDARYREAS